MRLDKYIAKAAGLSRTQAKREIRHGDVRVNQLRSKQSDLLIKDDDEVSLNGQVLLKPGLRYFMLNKPAGVVCANHDKLHEVAIDIFWQEPHHQKLSCVGRLDIDTTGLLLVSDDGQWSHKISSPNYDCSKKYHAVLDGNIDENIIQRFADGILLENEKHKTRPAALSSLKDNHATIEISEGRYHQVKRMFAACGLKVLELHRSQIGSIILDEHLEAGEYRELTTEEIHSI